MSATARPSSSRRSSERRPPTKPYKFLDAYGVDDAGIFFGRERECRVLLSDVLVNRLVVLFARSGTGKTSLINAGVRPRLEQQGYRTFFIRVQEDPAESARAELAFQLPDARFVGDGLAAQLETLVEQINQPIVLFFDQFEEFFIYVLGQDPDRGRRFIGDVARLYRNRDAGVHLVFSMREEFFVEMDAFRDEIPTIFHNESNLRLRPFDQQQARDALLRPAAAFSTELEGRLVERLLIDLAEEAGGDGRGGDGGIEPAQLQIVADTLWERRAGDRISLEQYQALGRGREGNIARHVLFERLEDCFGDLTSRPQLALLERLLPELRTKEGTKYVRDLESLVKALSTPEQPVDEAAVRPLLDLLEHARFIRRGRRDALEVVELSHDYLVGKLDDLQARVRLIWPRRMLETALANAAQGVPVTQEALEVIASSVRDLPVNRAGAETLLRAALALGVQLVVWFSVARDRGVDVWAVLNDLVGSDVQSIDTLSHVVFLCKELLKDVGFAADAKARDRALAILERALRRDDLTMESQDALTHVIARRHPVVSPLAIQMLLSAMPEVIDNERASPSAIQALGRIERPESVALLERALNEEVCVFEAQGALSELVSAKDEAVRERARDVLLDYLDARLAEGSRLHPAAIKAMSRVERAQAVAVLRRAMDVGGPAARDAREALDRLATSSNTEVAASARDALAKGFHSGAAAVPESRLDARENALRARRGSGGTTTGDATITSIAKRIVRERCTLILGAGVHAGPPPGRENEYPAAHRPPLGSEVAQLLATEIDFESHQPGESARDFRRVAELFALTYDRSRLIEHLKAILTRDRLPSPMLRILATLPVTTFITTNVDGFLEQALRAAGKEPIVLASRGGVEAAWAGRPEQMRPLVLKLNGDFDHPDSLVLTEEDFLDLSGSLSDESAGPIPRIVRAMAHETSMLVLGASMRTVELRLLLRALFGKQSTSQSLSYALDPFPDPLSLGIMERRYNTKVVVDDLWTFVPQLQQAVARLSSTPAV